MHNSRKHPYPSLPPSPTTEGIGNIRGRRFSEPKKFRGKYETQLKFPEGGGRVLEEIPILRQLGIISGTTQMKIYNILLQAKMTIQEMCQYETSVIQ